MRTLDHFMQHLYVAIDFKSVTLMGMSFPALFMQNNPFMFTLGVLATLSTIVYNGIRIYKEIKNKD